MTKKEKIQWLNNLQSGLLNVDESRKQMAIAKGQFIPLMGVDLEEYEQGIIPTRDLIMVRGIACRILSKQEFESGALTETYV